MARITVEDCLEHENNRFALVQLASKRTKQLLTGAKTLILENKGNKAVVTALREIAEGQVRFMTEEDHRIAREKAERERAEREERERETQVASPQERADSLFSDEPASNGTAAASENGDH